MIEEYLNTSKLMMREFANRVFLNEKDLEIDTRRFASLRQKAENDILTDYLIDIANDRIGDLEIFIKDTSVIEKYREELIIFLQQLVKEKL